jgi:exodeoxyribonuclease VII large subunit
MDPVRRIYTVSELTRHIKALLEGNFPFVWVAGEISNFRIPASGHFYLTLKDESAQINAVMFKGNQQHLKFLPEDGMRIIGLGRISLYEPRGVYQIVLEYIEPSGIGALQAAFEQLKKRLEAEGLFDASHKKPIPYLPRAIALITSTTGAVVHDMLNIIFRRFPTMTVQIIATKVQGDGAETEIAQALRIMNERGNADVAILARGGGSLEDLHAFNSETVARAIFSSRIPIVSAIGHETDFTIADFVSDLRAPTPSAAAEMVVPEKSELDRRIREFSSSLQKRLMSCHRTISAHYMGIFKRLVHPQKKIQDHRLRIDDLAARNARAFHQLVRHKVLDFQGKSDRLLHLNPIRNVPVYKQILDKNNYKLFNSMMKLVEQKKSAYRRLSLALDALSPLAILSRGYSIVRRLPEGMIVRDAGGVAPGQLLEIRLYKGSLLCRVEEIGT